MHSAVTRIPASQAPSFLHQLFDPNQALHNQPTANTRPTTPESTGLGPIAQQYAAWQSPVHTPTAMADTARLLAASVGGGQGIQGVPGVHPLLPHLAPPQTLQPMQQQIQPPPATFIPTAPSAQTSTMSLPIPSIENMAKAYLFDNLYTGNELSFPEPPDIAQASEKLSCLTLKMDLISYKKINPNNSLGITEGLLLRDILPITEDFTLTVTKAKAWDFCTELDHMVYCTNQPEEKVLKDLAKAWYDLNELQKNINATTSLLPAIFTPELSVQWGGFFNKMINKLAYEWIKIRNPPSLARRITASQNRPATLQEPVPPTSRPSTRTVGWPTPTGTL